MDYRQDFFRVLRGERPDRTPFIFMGYWDEESMHKLAPEGSIDENTYCYPSDYFGQDAYSSEKRTDESRKKAVELARHLGMATIGVGKGGVLPFGHGGPGEIQPHIIERTAEHRILQYEGGHKRIIHYNPHSVHYYDFPVETEADLDRLELPDMKDPKRFEDIADDCNYFKEHGFVPTGSIQGFFSGLHNSFMDFADVMVNLLLEEEFMMRFTERLALMSLDAAEMLLDRGVEVIDVCDDFGNQHGLLISPQLIRKFFIPWYTELTHRVHRKGGYVHFHSHGNIATILPDLAAAGIDIINPFDWSENPDLPSLVAEYGDKIVFCGGSMHDQQLLPIAEREEIIVRACNLRDLAERGYIYMGGQPSVDFSKEAWQEILDITHRVCSSR